MTIPKRPVDTGDKWLMNEPASRICKGLIFHEHAVAKAAVEALRKFATHHECDDPWYSCPKSEDGCANENLAEDLCTCGADLAVEALREIEESGWKP